MRSYEIEQNTRTKLLLNKYNIKFDLTAANSKSGNGETKRKKNDDKLMNKTEYKKKKTHIRM